MVTLTVTKMLGVGSDADMDREPERQTLRVPAATWTKAVALAETQRFRAPRKDFLPGQTAQFAQALRAAIDAPPVHPRRPSHQTALDQLNEFFRAPAQKKALLAILKLASSGGTLDVTNE
jgi:hypothetical protein